MSSLTVRCVETNQDITIPDGMWVAEATEGGYWGWSYQIEGDFDQGSINTIVTKKGVQESEMFGADEYANHLLVASQPFAVMVTNHGGMYEHSAVLECVARQVVSGKSQKQLSVKHPTFVRGAKSWRWVKLTELATLVGLSEELVWQRYFRAANQKGVTFTNDGEDTMTVVAGGPTSEPFAINFERHRNPWDLYELDLDDSYFGWNLHTTFEGIISHFKLDVPAMELNRLWVPAGWALNVCYLEKLGYQTPKERYRAYQASQQSETETV